MHDPESSKNDLIEHLREVHRAQNIVPLRWTKVARLHLHREYHRVEAKADAEKGKS